MKKDLAVEKIEFFVNQKFPLYGDKLYRFLLPRGIGKLPPSGRIGGFALIKEGAIMNDLDRKDFWIPFTVLWLLLFALVCGAVHAGDLSEHFSAHEFRCHHCGKVIVDKNLITKLEALRQHVDAPITITSGYRCPTHNGNVGGVKNSQHTLGKAADIKIKGMSPKEIAKAARWAEFGFVKVYKSFVHVDTRRI